MDTNAFFTFAVDSAGYQLRSILETLPQHLRDEKLNSALMSPREMLVHIADVYSAVPAIAAGREHKWGQFRFGSDDFTKNLETVLEMRSDQVQSILTSSQDEAWKVGIDLIVLHDSYHVGQLAQLRLAKDPDFDPYSIYNFS